MLEDKDKGVAEPSRDDATIKGRSLETEEEASVDKSTERGMIFPFASLIFTTASMVTPYLRRKGKEKMVESDTPRKKKLQEQIDVQLAREIEEQMVREDQRMNEQIARDAEIARIHAEEELQMLIDSLDKDNEIVAKYLQEYEQFAVDLSIRERIELINDLSGDYITLVVFIMCFLEIKKSSCIPTASDEFSLPEDFPTASEERFPLL
nr:hypothetical protein [Tanacetum cinerariifolium]